jgi:hypothetical protein
VVAIMVDLHRQGVDVRFQRIEGVREWRQCKRAIGGLDLGQDRFGAKSGGDRRHTQRAGFEGFSTVHHSSISLGNCWCSGFSWFDIAL